MNGMKVSEKININKDDFVKYLKIYNADIDWAPHLDLLKKRITAGTGRSMTQPEIDKLLKQISCSILLPASDPTVILKPPEKLLFACPKFSQFDSRDWYEELIRVVEQDLKNEIVRNQALSFGVVYPIEYNPRSRQAFLWLLDAAKSSDSIDNVDMDALRTKLENLVLCYGGAVICNVFDKREYSKKIASILNWRSGYFFERLIHEVYKSEEILKIKQHDINEVKRSNPKLVKQVKRQG